MLKQKWLYVEHLDVVLCQRLCAQWLYGLPFLIQRGLANILQSLLPAAHHYSLFQISHSNQ